jgi:hypothetical protein
MPGILDYVRSDLLLEELYSMGLVSQYTVAFRFTCKRKTQLQPQNVRRVNLTVVDVIKLYALLPTSVFFRQQVGVRGGTVG